MKTAFQAGHTEQNLDFEVGSLNTSTSFREEKTSFQYLKYVLAGIVFGIVLYKSEVMSWYRIQEMFRLQSFHMYGVIGSAVVVGMLSIWIIKRFKIKTIYGDDIELSSKPYSKGTIYGGLLFGLGWALTGACPGPLYTQVGAGSVVTLVTILAALGGTWVYGLWRDKLPH